MSVQVQADRTDGAPAGKWPKMPYKGFSYYDPADVPLFAGRDREIELFARSISQSETRFILLFGATGCGKSSFLRAGVIPFLESGRRGFEFYSASDEKKESKAIFIRSLRTPLQSLAQEIFRLASEVYTFQSPFGLEQVDLTPALFGSSDVDDFTNRVLERPEMLIDALYRISIYLPVILVIVIDQGEEALSLSRDPSAEADQAQYFKFLALFSRSSFPLKLIIALREDYFGRFLAAIADQARAQPDITYFRLSNMTADQLIEAITRPTQSEPVPGYGTPPYGFSFEKSLPQLIVMDLVDGAEAGGVVGGALPVLQVVCGTLYSNTSQRGTPRSLTIFDYLMLGEMETQLNDYLDRVLLNFCSSIGVSDEERALEIIRWKDALAPLAFVQANNAVTSHLKTLKDLESSATSKVRDFDKLLDYLADPVVGVLRDVNIRRIGFYELTQAFSLRHDAVGLVLARWSIARQASRGAEQSMYLLSLTGLVFYSIPFLIWVISGFVFPDFTSLTQTSLYGIGVATGLFGFGFFGIFNSWIRRRNPYVAMFNIQLRGVINPVAKFAVPKSLRLDRDGLGTLEKNPVFRLYRSTDPEMERLYERARRTLDPSWEPQQQRAAALANLASTTSPQKAAG